MERGVHAASPSADGQVLDFTTHVAFGERSGVNAALLNSFAPFATLA